MSGPVYSNIVRNYEDLNKMSDNEFERYVEKELGLIKEQQKSPTSISG